jgi:hypothetical protein
MDIRDRKPKFREYLKEDVEKRLKVSLDSLQPNLRSKEMTRFYVKAILSKLTPGLVPDDPEEIDDYIVDGPSDGGVDFIYPSDGRVLIVQAKFRSPDKHEEHEDFTHFCEAIGRLHDAYNKKQKLNRKITEALVDIDWETDFFDLHFITVAKVSDAFRARAEKGPTPVKGLPDFEERTELAIFNEEELNVKLREALSAGEILDQEVEIKFVPNPDGLPWMFFESESGRNLYVGEISGSQLAEMYRQYKYKLFAMNIRDYVGESSTNKGIIESATKQPYEFVFYNNGISAVATDIEPDRENNALRCRRFSIINGAQTVRSLTKAQVKDNRPLRDVRVLLRVMDFSLASDTEFLSDVTRFNNTQNSVKISDFRSNDPVQKNLNRRFADLSRAGRSYIYKNKRSRESAGTKLPIGMEDFAKTIHAFRYGPDDMYGGTRFLFDISPKGGYSKVFGEPVSHLTDDDFKLLAGTYFLCEEVADSWKQKRERDNEEGKNSPGLERRWVVFYAVGELLRMIYKEKGLDLDADLRKLGKPNSWMDSPTDPSKLALAELFKLTATAIGKAYNQAAKNTDFRHRNWFRNSETLSQIREELDVIPEYRSLDKLPILNSKEGAVGIRH